jgi:predicted RNA methylase
MSTRPHNQYQAQTTPTKLRGQYYTPAELVAMMLDELPLAAGDLVIDPACGDGSFLRGAVAALARRFPHADRQALAATWAGRLVGFDVDPEAVAEARVGLQAAFCRHLGVEVPEKALRVCHADVLAEPYLDTLLERAGVSWPRDEGRLHVVGNPPYVEAKRLARATTAALRQRYPEAVTGAPDLYLYFLHVCLGWLREADTLALVLPNKLLVNANAQRLRERLLDEGRLRALWLATRARIFAGASVYPIVLLASAPRPGECVRPTVAWITRTVAGAVSREEGVPVDPSWFGLTQARALFPPPGTPMLREALEALLGRLASSVPAQPEVPPGSVSIRMPRTDTRAAAFVWGRPRPR